MSRFSEDARARADEGLWRAREVLARQRAIGLEHKGIAQQAIFQFGNGFHSFDEPCDYVVVWPFPDSEVQLTPIDAHTPTTATICNPCKPRPGSNRGPHACPVRDGIKRARVNWLPALERVEEVVAAEVYIKGYDPPPKRKPAPRPAPRPFVEGQDSYLMQLLVSVRERYSERTPIRGYVRGLLQATALCAAFHRGWFEIPIGSFIYTVTPAVRPVRTLRT